MGNRTQSIALPLEALVVSVNTAGDNTLLAAQPGYSIRVYRLVLVAGADAVDIKFKSDATEKSGPMALSAYGSLTLEDDGVPWVSTEANEALVLNLSSSYQVGGFLFYALERA